MKKTISTYWPVAILVPIVLAAYLGAASSGHADAASGELASSANVSAELARAVSFGYVEPDGMWNPAGASSDDAAPAPRVL
ncbi:MULTISPECIES: hypothetical protein [unclassified Caballeronia]|uniref:hypothetical protein n=1 Tax=unclassified Caballeronia TaxID=2646786 RepID=UPI002863B499|nr:MULTISPECIES: hypothetical protein [unclassified Caballeronia]MDR5750154.1 hypothetical protein [Caballeronia sp. LZ024]MDR5842718.1 hypothetical protein [Caballeronia sp. LZ031]